LALLARQVGFVGDGLVNNFWEAVFHTNKYVGKCLKKQISVRRLLELSHCQVST
jgi:hypothetical protein